MVINLPRDDLGLLRLKDADAARAAAPVASLTAATRLGSQSPPTPSIPVAVPEERRRGDRRQGRQRRGQNRQTAVLLDTRSRYERRTRERRHKVTDQGQQYLPLGVDVHI